MKPGEGSGLGDTAEKKYRLNLYDHKKHRKTICFSRQFGYPGFQIIAGVKAEMFKLGVHTSVLNGYVGNYLGVVCI